MTDYSFKNGLYWAASQLEEDEMGNSFGIYFDYDLYYQLRTQIFLLTFEMGNWWGHSKHHEEIPLPNNWIIV